MTGGIIVVAEPETVALAIGWLLRHRRSGARLHLGPPAPQRAAKSENSRRRLSRHR